MSPFIKRKMMLSPESEVLVRHLPQFAAPNVLLFGDFRDDFATQLNEANQINHFSSYFNVAISRPSVEFGLLCHTAAEVAIFCWTKNKQECQFQLFQWLSEQKVGQQLWIVGENRSGVRSVEGLLSPLGDIAKIDTARRCSLYHFVLQKVPTFDCNHFWKSYRLHDLNIFALPAVFSAAELDSGSALLLSTFESQSTIKGRVLDLGCGAGVIGSSLKARFPTIQLTMSDIHAMALASARRTLEENKLEGDVVASDVFSHLNQRFDLIVSNPPFHDGIETNYQAVERLIEQAKVHINRGGELRLVANSFLPYPDLLDKAFGCHQVLAKSTKFKVYSVKLS